MILSMTGYGEAIKGSVRCELRSLNHRFFRASISLPPFLSKYENKIESLLRDKLLRGMVYCNIITTVTPNVIKYDSELAKRYRDALKVLKESLNLAGRISIDHLYGFSGVLKIDIDESEAFDVWKETQIVVGKASENLMLMRKKEGKRIEKVTRERVKNISSMLREVKLRIPERIDKERKRVEKISFIEEYDSLYLLERINVGEEISRLEFHLSGINEILRENTSQGKRLLFLLQELLREANTVTNKIQDAPISRIIVDIKTEVESLREEIENVL